MSVKQLIQWNHLLVRWTKMILGKSYYHHPQELGKAFRPGELVGYFNDLTAKTHWTSYTDDKGIPMNVVADGRRVYFATTVVQKALGHWDRWLLTHDEREKEAFLELCQWLLNQQDVHGGWPVWTELGLSSASPYSAMTQGEAISAFIRAWLLTKDESFLRGSRRSLNLMLQAVEDGGTSIYENGFLFLEEVPSIPRNTVLNGWIFALFGLYDYWLAFKDQKVHELFQRSLNTLKKHLYQYDAGYWSYYDTRRHLASHFYHNLHIHQLRALTLINQDHVLEEYRSRWIMYQKRRWNRIKAFGVKVIQKLKEPGEAVIIK